MIIRDDDQDSTDLMKCVSALLEKEKISKHAVCGHSYIPKPNYV